MTLGLEINDAGLVLAADGELLAEEPGVAMLDGTEPVTGTIAARRARLRPVYAENRHWQDLADAPLARPQPAARTLAEVAYAQLQTLQAQTRGATVPAAQKQAMEALDKELQALRGRAGLAGGGFGNPENVRGRVGQLKGAVMGATAAPTTTQIAQIREVRGLLPKLVSDANAAAAKVPALVRDLISAGVVFSPAKPGQ